MVAEWSVWREFEYAPYAQQRHSSTPTGEILFRFCLYSTKVLLPGGNKNLTCQGVKLSLQSKSEKQQRGGLFVILGASVSEISESNNGSLITASYRLQYKEVSVWVPTVYKIRNDVWNKSNKMLLLRKFIIWYTKHILPTMKELYTTKWYFEY